MCEYQAAYNYDPATHERIPNKKDLVKELEAAIDEEIAKGKGFHEHTPRYMKAMEAIRNV